MALIDLPGELFYPKMTGGTNTPPSLTSNLIDADGEHYGYAIQVPPQDDSKTIDVISWRTGTVTTGGDLDVRIEGIDSSGNADGTLATTNSNLVVAVDAADDNTWFDSTLTAGHTVSAGEMIGVILERPTSSTFAGNVSSFRRFYFGTHQPYKISNTGSPIRQNLEPDGAEPIVMAIHYSDGSYFISPGIIPANTVVGSSFTSLERGLKFQLPFACSVSGCWLHGGSDSVTGDYRLALYDSAGVPDDTDANRLAVITKDGEHTPSASGERTRQIPFDVVVELAANTVYRLTVDSATGGGVALSYFDVDAVDLMNAVTGGPNLHWTIDNGAGGWTDTTTRRPSMGLIISQIHDGAGGGGGLLVHPGMAGGMRG